MKQWVFNLIVIGGALVLTLIVTASVFGLNPFTFFGNLIVYLLAVPVLLMAVPFALGWLVPLGIQAVDDKADYRNDLPSGWHFLLAPLTGMVVGFVGMKWVIPLICQLPSLNTWPWEFLRFPPVYEVYAWGWFAVISILLVCGYAGYFIARDINS